MREFSCHAISKSQIIKTDEMVHEINENKINGGAR